MKKLFGQGHVAVWVALLALIVFGALRYDNFVSAYNLSSFLGYNSMFVLISVGMGLVIMTGGIDLSVGTVAALASVVAAQLSPHGLAVALPAGVAAGLAAGALNAGMQRQGAMRGVSNPGFDRFELSVLEQLAGSA